MIDVFLPPPDETKLKVRVGPDSAVEIEVIDIVTAHTDAIKKSKEMGVQKWTSLFVLSMQEKGINLSETTAVILVEKATTALVQIKKESRGLPEQQSTSEPQSPPTSES